MQTQPWIGGSFEDTGLLLLGESTYSWIEDGDWRHPAPDHAIDAVLGVIDDFQRAPPFMRKLSRALTGRLTPSGDHLRHAWGKVAFSNFVAGSVGEGAANRPTQEMWRAAAKDFPSLLDFIRPRLILAMGMEMWKNGRLPATDYKLTDNLHLYRRPDGETCACFAVRHPSARPALKWEDFYLLINSLLGRSLTNYSAPVHDHR